MNADSGDGVVAAALGLRRCARPTRTSRPSWRRAITGMARRADWMARAGPSNVREDAVGPWSSTGRGPPKRWEPGARPCDRGWIRAVRASRGRPVSARRTVRRVHDVGEQNRCQHRVRLDLRGRERRVRSARSRRMIASASSDDEDVVLAGQLDEPRPGDMGVRGSVPRRCSTARSAGLVQHQRRRARDAGSTARTSISRFMRTRSRRAPGLMRHPQHRRPEADEVVVVRHRGHRSRERAASRLLRHLPRRALLLGEPVAKLIVGVAPRIIG